MTSLLYVSCIGSLVFVSCDNTEPCEPKDRVIWKESWRLAGYELYSEITEAECMHSKWRACAANPPLSARKAIKLADAYTITIRRKLQAELDKRGASTPIMQRASLEHVTTDRSSGDEVWIWAVEYAWHARLGVAQMVKPPKTVVWVTMNGEVIQYEITKRKKGGSQSGKIEE